MVEALCLIAARCPIHFVYFAERMAERLRGIDGVEVEVSHAAMPYWKTATTPVGNPQVHLSGSPL